MYCTCRPVVQVEGGECVCCTTHSVDVAREGAQGVQDDEVSSCEGMDEAGAVALSQNVEDAGFIEVS